MIYRVQIITETRCKKIFLKYLCFDTLGGAAKIFQGGKANFRRNLKTTADRKSSLVSNDAEHLISHLLSIHFYCLSTTEKML